MIKKESMLLVSDNSGAKYAKCIGLYKKYSKAEIGDIIMVSVKKINKMSSIKVGTKYKAIILRTRKIFKVDNISYKFSDNAIALLGTNMQFVGNRLFGATVRVNKQHNLHKNISSIIEKIY